MEGGCLSLSLFLLEAGPLRALPSYPSQQLWGQPPGGLSALLLTVPGWNNVQRLVNRGHCQDPRQPSAGTMPTLVVFPGHQALAFMGWLLGVEGWSLQNSIVGSWWPSPRDPVCGCEPWPLPACQGNGGTLDLEVPVLPSSHLWKLLSPPPPRCQVQCWVLSTPRE